jgi:hypothetical protein
LILLLFTGSLFGQQTFVFIEKSYPNGLVKEKYQGLVVNGDTVRQGRYLYFLTRAY